MKYRVKFDKAYGLPIATKEYTLAQIANFWTGELPDVDEDRKVIFDDRDDWEPLVGNNPNPTRRLILYCLRVANRNPEPDRKDQLLQLCRKFKTRQPTFWPRFLRERYQYANTKDFFAIDYNDIIWEYYAYDDECTALGADPDATGRVLDAAPAYAELTRIMKELVAKLKAQETTTRRRGIVKST